MVTSMVDGGTGSADVFGFRLHQVVLPLFQTVSQFLQYFQARGKFIGHRQLFTLLGPRGRPVAASATAGNARPTALVYELKYHKKCQRHG